MRILRPKLLNGYSEQNIDGKLELNGPSMMSTHIRLVTFLKPSLSVSHGPFSLFHQSMLI